MEEVVEATNLEACLPALVTTMGDCPFYALKTLKRNYFISNCITIVFPYSLPPVA